MLLTMVPEISQIVPESLQVVPQPLIALTGKQTTSSSKFCLVPSTMLRRSCYMGLATQTLNFKRAFTRDLYVKTFFDLILAVSRFHWVCAMRHVCGKMRLLKDGTPDRSVSLRYSHA